MAKARQPGTGPKYLWRAVVEEVPNMRDRLSKAAQRAAQRASRKMSKTPTKTGLSVEADLSVQITNVAKGFDRYKRALSEEIGWELAEIGKRILERSNEYCPYEFGHLRNSAKAFLSKSGGKRGGMVYQVVGANSSGGGEVVGPGKNAIKGSAWKWNLTITYERWGNDGFDVARFCHENLEG